MTTHDAYVFLGCLLACIIIFRVGVLFGKLKNEYDRNILNAQLEMQEHTMQNISREIHDHIGLSLTLAKLNLTTMENASAPEEKNIQYRRNRHHASVGEVV